MMFGRITAERKNSFSATYVARELSRRWGRTLTTVIGLAFGVALVVPVAAVSEGLHGIQATALNPLSRIGTDLLVTRSVRSVPGTPLNSADSQALDAEQTAAEEAALIDLSLLGKPGDRFERDFFLPARQLTFSEDTAIALARVPGIAAVATSLTLVANHREGTVPTIMAQFKPQPQTIDIAPATPAELAAISKCQEQLIQSGRNRPQDLFSCLPERMRHVQVRQEVIRQVINPPETDINTTGFSIAGVDLASPNMGLLTPSQITRGGFFGRGSAEKEVVLDEAYAARKGLSVGSMLSLNGTSFTVVGLAQPPLGGLTADVYMSLPQLQQLSGRIGRINAVMIRVDRAADVDRVSRAIEAAFPGARVASAKALAAQVTGSLVDVSRITDQMGRVVALVVLAAAFLIASLVTLSSVAKRVRELGTLRALGWRKSRVVRQIVAESLLEGIAGGVLGVMLGVLATVSIAWFTPPLQATAAPWSDPSAVGEQLTQGVAHQTFHLEPRISLLLVLLALVLAILGGLIAGIAGSIRAARLRPADALRKLG